MSSMDVSLRKLWVLVMDRESWPAEVHGVPKIQTWLTELNTLKGFSIVSETEVDVFLSFPCFLYDPANVSNLISGVSAFLKPRLDVWKFLVHIMLTSRMQDLYYPSWELRWGLTFFSPVIFQICWCIERNILIVSSFSVLNSSAGFHCNH